MLLRKDQYPIALVNILAVIAFGFVFYSQSNYEFLIYIGVIILFFLAFLFSNKKVQFSNTVLWGLTVASLLHMSGGAVLVGDGVLYGVTLWPLSDTYEIFKYDQFVHMFGFAVATLAVYEILQVHLKKPIKGWVALSIVIIMAGLGIGALNEIVEFIVSRVTPKSGVGGYINTLLDLVFNLVGAILAMIYIRLRVVPWSKKNLKN